MHLLNHEHCQRVSGGKIKHDVMAVGLSISGATMLVNGLAFGMAAVTSSSSTLAKAAAIQVCAGVAVLATVAACEYTGLTEVNGWYETYQQFKYWKSYVSG